MERAVFFVANLTLLTWTIYVWPRLVSGRLGLGVKVQHCYVIDGSGLALMIAKASARFAGAVVKRLDYRITDMHDESGQSVRLRLLFHDMAQVQRDAMSEPVFLELLRDGSLHGRMPIFLAKRLAATERLDSRSVWRALHLVQACSWKQGHGEDLGGTAILFLERLQWLAPITRYAAAHGVTVVAVRPSFNLHSELRRRLPAQLIESLRYLRYRPPNLRSWLLLNGRSPSLPWAAHVNGAVPSTAEPSAQASIDAVTNSGPRVGVEYYGMLHLNHPERHSDLFFWQRSALAGRDVLLTSAMTTSPFGDREWAELEEHNVKAVLLHPGAARNTSVPVFKHRRKLFQSLERKVSVNGQGPDRAWLQRQLDQYHAVRAFWADLSERYNLKVYVTWYKYDATHCAIADGLQSTGGVTAIYQRAYEAHPSCEASIGADIVFGFSQGVADVERGSGSNIRYHVTTGYLGDHRFELVRASAVAVRAQLQQNGAKRILAFLDENSTDDPRWAPGHHITQTNYAYLLEKVLAEPWFGLVIKPKVPRTLRQRLGPVAHLLESAIATGRCHVYEALDNAINQGWHPPAEAALAADVTVHGDLSAATAGMEAALAGAPTLILDLEGWPVSPLYRLGIGTVVFTDWEGLWDACQQHWSTDEGIPGFGDWTPVLDDLDPFRDGRAAERMGTYIHWLIEGFKAGLGRESVMADAAERYCANWGKDKITEVSGGIQSMAATVGSINT